MKSLCLLPVLALAACGAEIGGAAGGDDTSPDANPIQPSDDGPAPAPCSGRVVYMNFDGVTLTKGTSDATQNTASWIQGVAGTTGTAPAYRAGDANRVALINEIVDGVRAQLAQFPITVTTSRPTTGEYVMLVFGGTSTQVHSRFGIAVNELDCGDVQRNDVAWLSDQNTGQRAINNALGAIGFGLGLTATTDIHDCMCSWDNMCAQDQTTQCKLTPGIARDPNANQRCAGQTMQDEVAVFRSGFCG